MTDQLFSTGFASINVPIARAPFIGVSLNHTNILDLSDILVYASRISIKIYWNQNYWQICPRPYPNPIPSGNDYIILDGVNCTRNPLGLAYIVSTLNTYFDSTAGNSPRVTTQIILELLDLGVGASPNSGQIAKELTRVDGLYSPSRTGLYIANSIYFSDFNDMYPTSNELYTSYVNAIFALNNRTLIPGYDLTEDLKFAFPGSFLVPNTALTTDQLPTQGLASCVNPIPSISMSGTGFDKRYPEYSSNTTNGTLVSWIFAAISDSAARPYTPELIRSVVNCGFSPFFTQNVSIDSLRATIWNWDTNEPDSTLTKNCVVSSRKWKSVVCTEKHPVACQSLTDYYSWTISETLVPFSEASTACPANTKFAAPKTPLEQRQLSNYLASKSIQNAWIDFSRSADQECWTSGGSDSCPVVLSVNLVSGNLKQGIFLLVAFLIFLMFQYRTQVRFRRENIRKQTVRRKVKQLEFIGVPVF